MTLRLAEESKCVSHSVACIAVKDNHIVSTGVNGTPPGYINCCDMFPNYNKKVDREAHHRWSNIHETHAEKATLSWMTREEAEGSQFYISVEPCFTCLKDMIQAGVSEIYYYSPYDKNEFREEMVALAKARNVIFERF